MLGSVTCQNTCHPLAPRTTAASSSPAPAACISGINSRGDEGKGDEDGGQHDARHGEDDPDVVGRQPGTEPALGTEQQNEDKTGDDRRDRERQVDQRDQELLAAELELGDGPGCATPKTRLSGTEIAAASSVVSRTADSASASVSAIT